MMLAPASTFVESFIAWAALGRVGCSTNQPQPRGSHHRKQAANQTAVRCRSLGLAEDVRATLTAAWLRKVSQLAEGQLSVA